MSSLLFEPIASPFTCPAGECDAGIPWILSSCRVYSWPSCKLHCTSTATGKLCSKPFPLLWLPTHTWLPWAQPSAISLCRTNTLQAKLILLHNHMHHCWWKHILGILTVKCFAPLFFVIYLWTETGEDASGLQECHSQCHPKSVKFTVGKDPE